LLLRCLLINSCGARGSVITIVTICCSFSPILPTAFASFLISYISPCSSTTGSTPLSHLVENYGTAEWHPAPLQSLTCAESHTLHPHSAAAPAATAASPEQMHLQSVTAMPPKLQCLAAALRHVPCSPDNWKNPRSDPDLQVMASIVSFVIRTRLTQLPNECSVASQGKCRARCQRDPTLVSSAFGWRSLGP
jgi:hypothetical protein